jgi:hypothetical protein
MAKPLRAGESTDAFCCLSATYLAPGKRLISGYF